LLEGISDFPEFIRWKLDLSRPYQYHIDTSIEHQVDYLKDLDGKIIVDFIGKYENLQADYEEACRRIGIKPPPLPHKRKAVNRRDYREYYDEATAEMIADYFQPDISAFGYDF
jgi:hypothetical protein